jgi:hypothetical protein
MYNHNILILTRSSVLFHCYIITVQMATTCRKTINALLLLIFVGWFLNDCQYQDYNVDFCFLLKSRWFRHAQYVGLLCNARTSDLVNWVQSTIPTLKTFWLQTPFASHSASPCHLGLHCSKGTPSTTAYFRVTTMSGSWQPGPVINLGTPFTPKV